MHFSERTSASRVSADFLQIASRIHLYSDFRPPFVSLLKLHSAHDCAFSDPHSAQSNGDEQACRESAKMRDFVSGIEQEESDCWNGFGRMLMEGANEEGARCTIESSCFAQVRGIGRIRRERVGAEGDDLSGGDEELTVAHDLFFTV